MLYLNPSFNVSAFTIIIYNSFSGIINFSVITFDKNILDVFRFLLLEFVL